MMLESAVMVLLIIVYYTPSSSVADWRLLVLMAFRISCEVMNLSASLKPIAAGGR